MEEMLLFYLVNLSFIITFPVLTSEYKEMGITMQLTSKINIYLVIPAFIKMFLDLLDFIFFILELLFFNPYHILFHPM